MVGIHIVATASRFAGPTILALRVPSFDPVPNDEMGTVTGHFNLDLFEIPSMPRVPDTYFLTAFSRDVVVGPVPLGIAPTVAG